MYIQERLYKIIVLLLVLVFGAGLFFAFRFFQKEIKIATEPSAETITQNTFNFDYDTFEKVLKKVNPNN